MCKREKNLRQQSKSSGLKRDIVFAIIFDDSCHDFPTGLSIKSFPRPEETSESIFSAVQGGLHVDEQIPHRRVDVYCNYCSGRVCSRWSDQVGGQRRPILGDCPPGVGPKVSRSLEAPTTERKLCPATTLDGCLVG